MNNIIESLDSYMLSNNFINKFEAYRLVPPEQVTVRPKKAVVNNKIGSSIEKKQAFDNSFFYIFIIMFYGEKDFQLLQMKENLTEKQLKLKVADTLTSRKSQIKTYNVASMLHMEEDLLHNKKIDIKTFFTLCAMENLNVILINKSIGFSLNSNEGELSFLVSQNKDTVVLEIGLVDKKQINNVHWLENIKKPLKAIAAYKIAELKELYSIVTKMDCDKKNKKELYDVLIQVVKL